MGNQVEKKEIRSIIAKQRRFFARGETADYRFRREQLRQLRAMLEMAVNDILEAGRSDLGKPAVEAYSSGPAFLISEIDHALRHLRRWMKPRRVGTLRINRPAQSTVLSRPLGPVLIIGPWNYPVHLVLSPLIYAIAAGNCAVVKPSEFAPASAALLARLIHRSFAPEYITCVTGGVAVSRELLRHPWGRIFYTGNSQVGRAVMAAAAEHLTPVTLELGGKNPCIVADDADLETAARRICWAKFYNAGQTCVAPDYLLVQTAVRGRLVAAIRKTLREFYGDDPRLSPDYARIINLKHTRRLRELLRQGRIIHGGEVRLKERYVSPTVIDEVSVDAPIMRQEVFGPVLPLVPVADFDDAIGFVRARPRPLALYAFTRDRERQRTITDRTESGGVCLNTAFEHLLSHDLPFGGVGASGMGRYRGRAGFETFSHERSVLRKPASFDLPLKYPPYRPLNALYRWLVRVMLSR